MRVDVRPRQPAEVAVDGGSSSSSDMAAPGRRTTLALGIVTGLLTTRLAVASEDQSNNVFFTDKLVPTFKELKSRGCLPSDFNSSRSVEIAKKCAQMVTANASSITDCGNAPVLALFFNCLTNMNGLVNAEGTFFNNTLFYASREVFTSDGVWIDRDKKMAADCFRASAADLTPRKQAVFTFSCWKWSLFADCDKEQEGRGKLFDAALLRRARFLSGSCPLSPIQLLDAFRIVTGRTWAECSVPLDTGADAQEKYDAEVSRVVCLLQDFTKANGSIDFARLSKAIVNEERGAYDIASKQLLNIVHTCEAKQCVTAEEMVKCWASNGVYSCAYMEANQLAHKLPQKCAIFV